MNYFSLQVPVPTVERKDDIEREDQLDQFFETLAGHDIEIDAWELQKIATFALKKGFVPTASSSEVIVT